MTVTLVAAVGANGVIGRDGDVPWHLPEDLAHFRRLTMGHVLVMGRVTYEAIGRPLAGRTTVVVTRQPQWRARGVRVAGTVPEALAIAAALDDEVFVVGGSEIYAATLSVADRMILSLVDQSPEGDRSYPDVEWSGWVEVDRAPRDGFTIVTYERRPALDPAR